MSRKIVDCRDMPSDIGCTLSITGEEDEVLLAAVQHAVAQHGHTDNAELRHGIRAGLRDAPVVAEPGAFVQMIEFRTNRLSDFDSAVEDWKREIGTERSAGWYLLGADRDRPGTYVQVVGFPSYEEAMRNSQHPATSAVAERLSKLAESDPEFRNLDVVRSETP
jgi:hypothetical protein